MLLQVHDELVFDVYKPELDAMKTLIKEEMENAYSLSVPLDVEMDMGAELARSALNYISNDVITSLSIKNS